MTVFNETLTDTVNNSHVTPIVYSLAPEVQGMGITPIPYDTWGFLKTISETVNMSLTEAYLWFALKEIVETVRLSEAQVTNLIYTQAAIDTAGIAEQILLSWPVELTQGMSIEMVSSVQPAYQILETIGLADPTLPTILARMTVAETLQLASGLGLFLEMTVNETINMGFVLVALGQFYKIAAESLTIQPNLVGVLSARAVMEETVGIDDLTALRAIFSPVVVDGVEFEGIYIQPDGSFTTWAINTGSGAVTEYTNFAFNSFAELGGKYVAASSSGLYELLGNTDAGAAIIPRIKGGMMSLGQSKYTSFKNAYIGVRDNGLHNDIFLKLVTGDGKSYTYKVQTKTMETTKVNFGKGLRARYFSYELYNTGADFDLDSIEFIPIINSRRT